MLELGISRSGTSRALDAPEPDDISEFHEIRTQILDREDFSCSYCGFSALKYQHVHHKNGNHKVNTPDNLECCDPLCHLCNHLWYVGDNSMGKLVMVPELTQEQLNAIQRSAWVLNYKHLSMDNPNEVLISLLQRLNHYIALIERTSIQVERVYGFSDPKQLADIFANMTDEDYEIRTSKYKGVRLLYNPKSFKNEIQHWADSDKNYASMMEPKNWVSMAKHFVKERGIDV